jgi:recombination protein RecA
MGCTLDAALDLDIVERKGSWYAYKGNNLAQGRQNVVDMLKKDDELALQLEAEVRLALSDLGNKLTQVPPDELVPGEVVDAEFDAAIEAESFLE